MRISKLIVRSATVGLCAFAAIALSNKSVASNNGPPSFTPIGSIGPQNDDSNRSEDGIGTGPLLANPTFGEGYSVVLPTLNVGSLLVSVSGSGSVRVQDMGNGLSVVKLSGNLNFQLSVSQMVTQSIRVANPIGNTVGQIIDMGSDLRFLQRTR